MRTVELEIDDQTLELAERTASTTMYGWSVVSRPSGENAVSGGSVAGNAG